MRDDSVRRIVTKRLREDLIGPLEEGELIVDLPSDRYLTGILFPQKTETGGEQADEADTADDEPDGATGAEGTSLASTFRPSAAGLSFAFKPAADGMAGIRFNVSAGRYMHIQAENAEQVVLGAGKWQRLQLKASFEEFLEPTAKPKIIGLAEYGIGGLDLHLRVKEWHGQMLVTAALVNTNFQEQPHSRQKLEEATFFQVAMEIEPALGAELCRKPDVAIYSGDDPEAESSALIYSDIGEYAVGHTCSADWIEEAGMIRSVRTQWVPEVVVKKSVETGDSVFDALLEIPSESPLNTKWLSQADERELLTGLSALPALYAEWIGSQQTLVNGLDEAQQITANRHLDVCSLAQHRIERGIELIRTDPDARAAFQWANRAIWLQNRWKGQKKGRNDVDLVWRPFQLAFVLLCLSSTSDSDDPHRDTMDLLWFPTGGGKTEAYLLLTAYAIFLRRLRAEGDVSGAGVTAFMRYTLRLLTVQQFQRAAAVTVACELIRRSEESGGNLPVPHHFASDQPISIGLWVGDASSPNKVADAIEALNNGSASTPRQLSNCPICNSELKWQASADSSSIHVYCQETSSCTYGKLRSPLPVWTVDEDIYRVKPTLIIGTADKYVQLPRNGKTGVLFGLGSNVGAPDLIIQDELHLISGPLGTVAGLYEIAVDELASRNGVRPKVIGSTATIKRAESQIRALFNRDAFQFPPPGLHHSNSGFAMLDRIDPGRLYIGVTTAGRSAKFALQAVTASILQSVMSADIDDNRRDEHATLVTYFNSLRELGGALVLMRDDVGRSVEEYAARREERARDLRPPVELTSRVTSSEIPDLLARLELPCDNDDGVDAVLATNMISVGVDVPRLGAMVVNGQPKGIAEYIQATSRVGRDKVPGLVVTVYNANKARDRSRYETFTNWHQSLYRDVEATSVTPFAPRARDRAIHAVLVAIVRHLVPGMQREPVEAGPAVNEISAIIEKIVERARLIDRDEAKAVGDALHDFLNRWIARGRIRKYWDDWGDEGLLMSAEKAAERASGRRNARWAKATPNSLRSVEPSSAFLLRPDRTSREEQQ